MNEYSLYIVVKKQLTTTRTLALTFPHKALLMCKTKSTFEIKQNS